MMACNECGRTFGEEDMRVKVEGTGIFSEGFRETVELHYCPHCGSEDIQDAHHCEFCGDWTHDFLCNDCRMFIRQTLESLICESARLHRKNHVRFNRIYAENAIADVMEDL